MVTIVHYYTNIRFFVTHQILVVRMQNLKKFLQCAHPLGYLITYVLNFRTITGRLNIDFGLSTHTIHKHFELY